MVGLLTPVQFWHSGIVVACVCLSLCPCVCQTLASRRDNLSPVQAKITKFRSEVQATWFPIVLGHSDFDFQCQIWLERQNLHFLVFHAITHHQLILGFPNLDEKCTPALCLFWASLALNLNCFNVQTEWDSDYNSSFLQRLCSGNRRCCNLNFISVST